MARIALKGSPIFTIGSLPSVGSPAPDFRLTGADLQDKRLREFLGKTIILNIVPSLDTSVCALSAKAFGAAVAGQAAWVVLTVSCDLPFAQSRFCKSEGVANVVFLSAMRDQSFGKDYGVEMIDGPLAGILSRAVIIVDKSGIVRYTEQVRDIAQEPDYTSALWAAEQTAP